MPGRVFSIRCAAKINLYLDVKARRDDGFHDIETLFQPVSIYDTIDIEMTGGGVSVEGDDPSVPWDSTNTCHRAAVLALERAGSKSGVSIKVKKGIPWGAGLGGGSADAAAVIVGIDTMLGSRLGLDKLMSIGVEIGSDVPFFIFNAPAVGRGRGEILERAEGLKKGWIVIVKPPVSVSTEWAYRNLNLVLTTNNSGDRLNCLLEGLKAFPDRPLDTFNSFQDLVVSRHPEIGEVLGTFKDEGAGLASLSGSGTACFALFKERETAEKAKTLFAGKGYFAATARPVDKALELVRW